MTYRSCPRCRRVLPADAKFCDHCGMRLDADPEPQTVKRTGGKKTWVLPGIAAAAAVALFLLIIFRPEAPAAPGRSGDAAGTAAWAEHVLMEDPYGEMALKDAYQTSVLGSPLTREEIAAITVLDSLEDCPEGAWDVSRNGDGSVLAWTEENDTLYDLFIGAEGGVAAPEDCTELFSAYPNLRAIHFNGAFHTDQTRRMDRMFASSYQLESVDVEDFETSNVTSMRFMFSGCQGLQELDVSGFDTSQVTDMASMFTFCWGLTELDVSGFDTSRVTDMSYMFSLCQDLRQLDVSGFDTGNVANLSHTFYYCEDLKELDLSGWDVSGVTDMDNIFGKCSFSPLPQFGSGGEAVTLSAAQIQDPDAFFQNKMVRDVDQTTDTGGVIRYVTDYGHNAFWEYMDYLLGGDFPLELVSSTSDSVYDRYYINYTGSGTVERATSTDGLSAYNLVVVFTHIKGIDKMQLNIYYGDGFTFADFGGRCTDTSFEDRSGGDTQTGHFTPGGDSGSGGSETSIPSSDIDSSRPISCAFCNGSGRRECYSCDGTGKEEHYVSGGGYDGVGPGTWELETCTTCSGRGSIRCTACQGDGIANN